MISYLNNNKLVICSKRLGWIGFSSVGGLDFVLGTTPSSAQEAIPGVVTLALDSNPQRPLGDELVTQKSKGIYPSMLGPYLSR